MIGIRYVHKFLIIVCCSRNIAYKRNNVWMQLLTTPYNWNEIRYSMTWITHVRPYKCTKVCYSMQHALENLTKLKILKYYSSMLIWLECSLWWCIALGRKNPHGLNTFCVLRTIESRTKIWLSVLLLLNYCLFTSHCSWGFCVGLCTGMHYFVSFLVHTWETLYLTLYLNSSVIAWWLQPTSAQNSVPTC